MYIKLTPDQVVDYVEMYYPDRLRVFGRRGWSAIARHYDALEVESVLDEAVLDVIGICCDYRRCRTAEEIDAEIDLTLPMTRGAILELVRQKTDALLIDGDPDTVINDLEDTVDIIMGDI